MIIIIVQIIIVIGFLPKIARLLDPRAQHGFFVRLGLRLADVSFGWLGSPCTFIDGEVKQIAVEIVVPLVLLLTTAD